MIKAHKTCLTLNRLQKSDVVTWNERNLTETYEHVVVTGNEKKGLWDWPMATCSQLKNPVSLNLWKHLQLIKMWLQFVSHFYVIYCNRKRKFMMSHDDGLTNKFRHYRASIWWKIYNRFIRFPWKWKYRLSQKLTYIILYFYDFRS